MNSHTFSRASLMLAGVLGLVLAAGSAQAENQRAGKPVEKTIKPVNAVAVQPAASKHPQGAEARKDDAEYSDMIMLQEPFRPSPMTPVNADLGR